MASKTSLSGKGTHGGAGRNQGDKKQCVKDVTDESKNPRLESFFSPAPSAATKPDKCKQTGTNKRPRVGNSDSATGAHKSETFAPPQEPPDVAPAAKSYLLGRDGIIAQALTSLKTGATHAAPAFLTQALTHRSAVHWEMTCSKCWFGYHTTAHQYTRWTFLNMCAFGKKRNTNCLFSNLVVNKGS
jgi:hypothetical protein